MLSVGKLSEWHKNRPDVGGYGINSARLVKISSVGWTTNYIICISIPCSE